MEQELVEVVVALAFSVLTSAPRPVVTCATVWNAPPVERQMSSATAPSGTSRLCCP
jgi:Na+(H+)/acetate symporter ActP